MQKGFLPKLLFTSWLMMHVSEYRGQYWVTRDVRCWRGGGSHHPTLYESRSKVIDRWRDRLN